MKAKTRRRLLISSIAMLLVAMLALGTATFAWFTSSTTATANGINVKTIKASELQISSATGGWGTTVDYGVSNKILMPTSTVNGTNWFKADAALKSNFAAKGSSIAAVTSEDANKYYFVNQLNVRNNGSADVDSVEITFTVPGTYARVALVETNAKLECGSQQSVYSFVT